MKNLAFVIGLLIFGISAHAVPEEGPWFITPFAAIGANSQQGTSIIFGLDAGLKMDENWRVGITSHYGAGNSPEKDREYGAGIFAGYALALSEVFVAHARQEIGYLDVRNPFDPEPVTGPKYESENGTASTTSVGVTTYFTDHLALSIGYRFVMGLTNSDLGDGRSGPTFGILLGI